MHIFTLTSCLYKYFLFEIVFNILLDIYFHSSCLYNHFFLHLIFYWTFYFTFFVILTSYCYFNF